MGLGDTFSFYSYNSDDGTTYTVKLSAAVATAGGFSEATGTFRPFPFGSKNLRHVWGVDNTGKRARCPVASNTNGLYVGGTSIFDLHGRTYNAEGRIGERRDLRDAT